MNAKPEIKFDYDGFADVLQVTFGTGEPSFGYEANDYLVLDVGMYSGTLTGFQVLNLKERNKGQNVDLPALVVELRRKLEMFMEEQECAKVLRTDRSRIMGEALEQLGQRRDLVFS